jgi:hypothetical protein
MKGAREGIVAILLSVFVASICFASSNASATIIVKDKTEIPTIQPTPTFGEPGEIPDGRVNRSTSDNTCSSMPAGEANSQCVEHYFLSLREFKWYRMYFSLAARVLLQ